MLFLLQNVNEQYLGDIFFDASLMIWSVALAVITQMGLCSAFICTLWVAFPLLAKLMIHKELSQKGMSFEGEKLYFKSSVPTVVYWVFSSKLYYLNKRNPTLWFLSSQSTHDIFATKKCSWTKDSLKIQRRSVKKYAEKPSCVLG